MAKKLSLKQQLEQANTGDVIVTDQQRTGVYVAAKRAGVNVTTAREPDDTIRITVNAKLVKAPEPKISEFDRTLNLLNEWTAATRLKLFEQFELCCGMKRGNCICEPGIIAKNAVVIPATDNPLADFIAKAQAKKGITQTIQDKPTLIDHWDGWSEERTVIDGERGDVVTYREHIKTRKRQEVKRETYYG